MCQMVWIAATRPLPERAAPPRDAPDPEMGWACCEPVAPDAAVRARFTLPHVSYVGSDQGCGCGFGTRANVFWGVETEDERRALAAALTDDERAALARADRVLAWLRAMIEAARAWGPVELFSCWDGDEVDREREVRAVEPAWLDEEIDPFDERVRYVIAASAAADATRA